MYDQAAFEAESAATNQRYQQALDLLYAMGCQYSVKDVDMRLLCDHCGVYWEDFLKHNTSNSKTQRKQIYVNRNSHSR